MDIDIMYYDLGYDISVRGGYNDYSYMFMG